MTVVALLSRADATPLRVALRLGAAGQTGTTALRAGPAAEEDLLRAALDAGAGRAVRVWDEVLDAVDYLGLACALAGAVNHVQGALVIAADRGQGAVGPAIAEKLGLPHLCGVVDVEPGPEGTILVRRRTRTGVQRLRGPARAVLCVLPQEGGPAPAASSTGEIEQLSLEPLGLSAAQIQHRRFLHAGAEADAVLRPRPLRFATAIELVERLQRDGLLPRR